MKKWAHLIYFGARRIFEVGALAVNGSLRSLCPKGVYWNGVDSENGDGVDEGVRGN
jgi:hypothetical protein